MPGESLGLTLVHNTVNVSSSSANEMLHYVARALEHFTRPDMLSVDEVISSVEQESSRQCSAVGKSLNTSVSETLVDQFQSIVDATPLATAIVDSASSVSYQQLDKRANQVAHSILASPACRLSDVVAIMLPSGINQLIFLLGVLKAGKAYLPIDPSYPDSRVEAMLSAAGVRLIAVDESHARHIPPGLAALTLNRALEFADHRPNVAIDGGSLAYVMFTSGSTGNSKGVEVTHANVVYSTNARQAYYGACKPRFLLLSSISFDSSVAGIYWSLTSGGCLVLPPSDGYRDVNTLAQLCRDHGVTHTLCLPTIHQLILDYVDPSALSSMEAVIVAGETCSSTLVKVHQQKLPSVALFNEYGPTEATVWCTAQRLDNWPMGEDVPSSANTSQLVSAKSIPIGRPIPGASVWVLDNEGNCCPNKVSGEICVASDGVARGYLNAVEATADRFVVETINGKRTRLYRTGDRGYWDNNDRLYFQGRLDRQVKVRGFRIDPTEVETVIERHPAIEECVVVARPVKAQSSVMRLIAFYTPSATPSLEKNELRNFVLASLPAHCCPTQFLALESMPRLVNGKISEHGLPEAVSVSCSTASQIDATLSATAKNILTIVNQVLGDSRSVVGVSLDDNFFAIGGDSISAMRVCAEIQHVTGVGVSLKRFFESDTLNHIVLLVESVSQLRSPDLATALQPGVDVGASLEGQQASDDLDTGEI